MSNPTVYLGSRVDVPIVAMTTNRHKVLTSETLLEAIRLAKVEAQSIVDLWDKSDWFPCGFANLWVEGRSPLVKLIKKQGRSSDVCSSYTDYGSLSMSKGYPNGYRISWRDIPITGPLGQCMNLKARCYGKLAEQLAFLGIRVSVRTMVD